MFILGRQLDNMLIFYLDFLKLLYFIKSVILCVQISSACYLFDITTDCPEQPINVRLFDITSRGLFINWTEPHDNNAPINGYNITYQNPDRLVMAPNNQPQDVTVTSMEEQAMITDLYPGENYSFIVIAINDICPSEPSVAVSVRTMEEGVYCDSVVAIVS